MKRKREGLEDIGKRTMRQVVRRLLREEFKNEVERALTSCFDRSLNSFVDGLELIFFEDDEQLKCQIKKQNNEYFSDELEIARAALDNIAALCPDEGGLSAPWIAQTALKDINESHQHCDSTEGGEINGS